MLLSSSPTSAIHADLAHIGLDYFRHRLTQRIGTDKRQFNAQRLAVFSRIAFPQADPTGVFQQGVGLLRVVVARFQANIGVGHGGANSVSATCCVPYSALSISDFLFTA
jgi:hypothetical protein